MADRVASLEAVFTANTTPFQRGADRVDSRLTRLGRDTSRRMQEMGRSISNAGLRIAGFGLAAGGALSLGIGAAARFEDEFNNVRKTVDGSEEDLLGLRDTIREMATDPENPLSSLEDAHSTLSDIMEVGGQLGIATDNLADFTQVVGEMDVASELNAEEAAFFMSRFASATKTIPDDMDSMASSVTELGNNMSANEKPITNTALRMGLAGHNAGMSAPDILGFAAVLAASGISAELAGTNFSRFVDAIDVGVDRGGKRLDTLARVSGTTTDEFKRDWEEDATGALDTFLEKFADLGAAEQADVLEDLGLGGAEARRVVGTLADMTKGQDDLARALGLANRGWALQNTHTKEAENKADGTRKKFNRLKNNLRDVGIEIGLVLLPAINELIKRMLPVIDGIKDWIAENPRLVVGLAAITIGAVALGGAMVVLGGIVWGFGTALGAVITAAGLLKGGLVILGNFLVSGFSVAVRIATGAVGLLRVGVMALLSPIGLAVTAGIALGVAIYSWLDSLGVIDKLRDVMQSAMSAIRDAIQEVIDFVGGLIDAVEGAINRVSDLVSMGRESGGIGNSVYVTGDTADNIAPDLGVGGVDYGGYNPGMYMSYGGGRAAGGPVTRGKAFLVGEQGPELFVPNTSGNIIPNNTRSGGGGVQTIVLNNPVFQGVEDVNALFDQLQRVARQRG